MQPQVACVSCNLLRSCLQQALGQAGLIAGSSQQSPLVSQATHFFKRWSNRKLAQKDGADQATGP
mgnify:CR=1 FL=1|jgi:hypothetical protein